MLFLASRQQRRFAQNTLQQPDGACPVPPAISAAHALSRKQKLLCYFGLLFCWLFWFLYQFPGVLTPDSISQFSQATGLIPFSNHHPILHTLFVLPVLPYRIFFDRKHKHRNRLLCIVPDVHYGRY